MHFSLRQAKMAGKEGKMRRKKMFFSRASYLLTERINAVIIHHVPLEIGIRKSHMAA